MSKKDWADVKVAVRRSTHKRLKQIMKYGDTFDSIINQIIDENETLKRRLEKESEGGDSG